MNLSDIVNHTSQIRFSLSDYIINFEKLLDWNYLTAAPGPNFNFYFPAIILSVLFIISGVIVSWYNRRKLGKYPPKNKFFKKVFLTSEIMGLSILALLFFRYEGIFPLSSRLIPLGFFSLSLIWLGYLGYYRWFRFPEEVNRYESWLLKQKYLPKSGKGKKRK
jgi:hypothetical protein